MDHLAQAQSMFPESLLQGSVLAPCQPRGALQARSPFLHLAVGLRWGSWEPGQGEHSTTSPFSSSLGPDSCPWRIQLGTSHLGSASGKLGKAAGFSMEQMCLMGVFVSGFLKVGCFFF